MKPPRKHFAVEIKRSRRFPTPSMDLMEKDRADLGRPIPGSFSQADLSPRVAPDSDFAVPAFLKTDKAPARTVSDSAAKQVELVFGPKSAADAGGRAFPGDGRPAPRILRSLAPAENPIAEQGAEPLPQATAERRRRRKDASSPAPQPPVAKADRTEPIIARKKRGAPVPAKEAAKRKAAPAPNIAFATPSATPAPPISDATISQTGESAARNKHRGRRWAGARRNRDDAAALPPGQQWKRRLNPRAW
jgi:hypothetical protein